MSEDSESRSTPSQQAPRLPTVDELRELAVAQRRVILAVLLKVLQPPLAFLLIVTGLVTFEDGRAVGVGSNISVLYYLVVTVFAIYAIGKLAALIMPGQGIGCLYAFLMFIPLVGIIALLMLNNRATRLLRKYGVSVGLMGADMKSIRDPAIDS
ncbi:MAG: hypothetical protein RH917_09425 [Lacipirellulaceae bacterium]